MRSDGDVTFFFVQHFQERNGRGWVASSLDHLLFTGMTFDERRGGRADRYRELMQPQMASSDLWQRYGINGYVNPDDAFAVLDALRERRPDMRFRVVKRRITQTTTAIERVLQEVPA
jgi:hypothetical protein